ncbi:MAG: hypothetical protein JWM46_624 [Candidatus Kaiserbacteria bacterium]|nr:hypothetical protein [Candidatus Kaiserbacteria bacterium]
MLILHTLVFAALVVGCFTSPLFAYYYPELFKIYVLWVFGGIGILILGSWYFYSGACPLTVWENDFRKKEGKEPYSEGCMDRYAMRWFGLKLPPHFSDIVPIAILFIPLITRIFV